MSKPEKKLEAKSLREAGKTIPEIAKELGVSKGSVSLWLRKVELTDEQRDALYNRAADRYKRSAATKSMTHRKLRMSYQQQGRSDAQHSLKAGDFLHIKGCMLYWAEGGKCKNSVRLGNSDVCLLRLFVRFLRDCYVVRDANIKITVLAYSNNGMTVEEIKSYWLHELGLVEASVKVSVDRDKRVKTGSRKNIHKYGICEVVVHDTQVVQCIYGAIKEYAGICDDVLWLD